MAISTEDANKVWQKVKIALAALEATPFASDVFKALKNRLSTIAGNPNLEFIPISNLTTDVVEADAACKLYAVYVKKRNTATDAYFKVFDDATNDATSTDARLSIGLLVGGAEGFYIDPKGLDLAAGLVIGSYTTVDGANGTTASTSGDGPDGFAIIGAP